MAVKIRMSRMGRRHRPFFRINVLDSRTPRDGRIIEKLGHYDPLERDDEKQVVLNIERVRYWLEQGAIPSEAVSHILLRKGIKHKQAEQRAARRQRAKQKARATGKPFDKADRATIQKAADAQRAKAEADAKAAKEAKKKAEADAKAAEEAKKKAEKEKPKAEEKPAEAKSAKEPAPEEKPAEAPEPKPTEEPPAEEKPAEEQKSEEKQQPEEKPAPEEPQPKEEPPAEKPAPEEKEIVKVTLKKLDGTVGEKSVEKPKYGGVLNKIL